MMGFTGREREREREREKWRVPGRMSAFVPFIVQLSRKSLLMERHLQGISPMLLWMGRNGGGEHLKIDVEGMGRHQGVCKGAERKKEWMK